MESKYRAKSIFVHVILIIFSFIMLVPFAWMILTALKTNQESISVNPFYILPHNGWHWENLHTASDLLPRCMRVPYRNHGRICIRKTEIPGQDLHVHSGPCPDDDSFPDLHHSAVPDGIQDGNAKYDLWPCVPRSCNSIWYIPAQDRL